MRKVVNFKVQQDRWKGKGISLRLLTEQSKAFIILYYYMYNYIINK